MARCSRPETVHTTAGAVPQRARKARSGAFAPSDARRFRPYKTYSRAPSAAARPVPAGRRGLFETARLPPRPDTRPAPAHRAARASTPPAAPARSPADPKCAQGSRPLSNNAGRAAASVSPNSCPACATRNKTTPALCKKSCFFIIPQPAQEKQILCTADSTPIYIINPNIIVEIIMNFCYTGKADTSVSAQ